MNDQEIKDLVWRVANEATSKGPGWAQEGVVLRQIWEQIREQNPETDLKQQQKILEAWHDLFLEKRLGWGYNLDNPNSPFFHIR